MSLISSRHITGTHTVKNYDYYKQAYRNGKKIEQAPRENGITAKDTIVSYNLDQEGNAVVFSSKEEAFEDIEQLSRTYGENVIVEISSGSLNKYIESEIQKGDFRQEIDSRQQLINSQRNKTFASELKSYTPEEMDAYQKQQKLFQDDGEKILNHSFVNEAFNFNKDFEKAAYGYAKYLNPDIQTEYDDDIFYNCQDEELYRQQTSGGLAGYADNILSYFDMDGATEEEKARLKNQLADAVIEYAKNIASGNRDVENVKTKLTVSGVDFTYGELVKTQELLQKVNEAGVSHAGNAEDANDYLGLSTNYDSIAFAQLGLRTSQVNYFCGRSLSGEAGDLVKQVWNERVKNTIQMKYMDPLPDVANAVAELEKKYKPNGTSAGMIAGSEYIGSTMEYAYNLFAGIDASDKDSFLQGYTAAKDQYIAYLQTGFSSVFNYVESDTGKKEMAYMDATKWID